MAEDFYVTFGDYCRIAAEVLETTPEQIARLPRIALADSALASGLAQAVVVLFTPDEVRRLRRAPVQAGVAGGRLDDDLGVVGAGRSRH